MGVMGVWLAPMKKTKLFQLALEKFRVRPNFLINFSPTENHSVKCCLTVPPPTRDVGGYF